MRREEPRGREQPEGGVRGGDLRVEEGEEKKEREERAVEVQQLGSPPLADYACRPSSV
jgi:hypothetical protein